MFPFARPLAAMIVVAMACCARAEAQWMNLPTNGLPHKADGKVDLSAPAPKMADGHPDFSGFWTSDEIDPRNATTPVNDANPSRRMINLGVELKGGLPYQPWLADLVKQRRASNAKDDPHVRCMPLNFLRAYGMPHLLKFVHSPGLFLTLNEWNAGYRQIFTDGRAWPVDPNPSWQGYSVGKWQDDALIVETTGFRDDLWIDWNGSVITSAAKVREEFRRPDLGHIEIRVTVDDPKAYTAPWTVLIKERLILQTELIDEICLENERSLEHMK